MAKGLDIGTCWLVCASKDPKNPQSEVQINSVRDAFLDIEAEQSVLNMLKMSNISHISGEDNNVYIIGESALSMANLFKREARRPLSKGIIAAGDLDAEKILVTLIKSILKEPAVSFTTNSSSHTRRRSGTPARRRRLPALLPSCPLALLTLSRTDAV